MKKLITYCLFLVAVLTACEDIYIPKIETRENVFVAEASITVGSEDNVVLLYESLSYNNEKNNFSGIPGARITIIDNKGEQFELLEETDGVFPVKLTFDPNKEYKIKIQYQEDIYESSFEPVPKVPYIDSLYGIPGEKVIVPAGSSNSNDFRKSAGVQIYADITHEKELPYYRFSGRKVLQYTYAVEVIIMGEPQQVTVYGWYSFYPLESFNIAAPPDYSNTTDIIKHPIFFLEQKAQISFDRSFAGWILIFYQFGLSKSSHNYYKDLNYQLNSEGRLFDPLYVQARSNIKCTTDKNKIILGNFEISTMKEYRYYVKYNGPNTGYIIKPIPYFYDIPISGEQLAEQPDFWEYPSKIYPDE